ncbi:MAG: HupE/UreJ family protein [Cypionkella sp.]
MKRILIALALLLAPSVALAHPGHGFGLHAGFLHPFTGTDHLLAMAGVGLWAAILGGQARWALPAGFLGMMTLGGAWAMNLGLGPAAAAVEPAILASVILLGAVVALALRAPLVLALPLVGLFGLAHGAAHGAEMVGNGLAFSAAMLTATALLHGAGLGLGLALNGRIARALGGATALAGLALAFA